MKKTVSKNEKSVYYVKSPTISIKIKLGSIRTYFCSLHLNNFISSLVHNYIKYEKFNNYYYEITCRQNIHRLAYIRPTHFSLLPHSLF